MNKYERYLLDKDLKTASKIDMQYTALCHADIVSRRWHTKNFDRLAFSGYERDIFGNIWRKGSGNPFIG